MLQKMSGASVRLLVGGIARPVVDATTKGGLMNARSRRWRDGVWLIVGAALIATLSGCPTNWMESSLRIHTDGVVFVGDKAGMMKGAGTGFWLDREHIATNAHVAIRAQRLTGISDSGVKYHFSTIVAFDPNGDIAILKADRPGDMPAVRLMEKPLQPRTLRGEDIVVTGNTRDLGLSLYHDKVTNIVPGGPDNEQVVHNTNTAPGASGSAIYREFSAEVMGIHHTGSPWLNAKVGTASWRLKRTFEAAKRRKGVPLSALFTFQSAMRLTSMTKPRGFCLAPGQALKLAVNAPRNIDFVTVVQATKRGDVLFAGLQSGNNLGWKGAIKDKAVLPFTVGGGAHQFILMAPRNAPGKVCGSVGVGYIEWGRGIQ